LKLVTSAQMLALEQAALAAGATVEQLMEQAGLAVAQEAWLSLGVVEGRRILVLVGPGNNGGDGLVAAAHLAEWGADVAVYMLLERSGDTYLDRISVHGVPAFVATEDSGYHSLQEALDGAELIVDALLGTGRSRPIEGSLADVLRRVNAAAGRPTPPKIIAVDLPTGVDADSGRVDPLALAADMTVTFGFAKVGLYTLPGSDLAGQVQVVDIGLPKDAAAALPIELLSTPWLRERLPKRPTSANKGTFGRVLVVAGSTNYVGAARLAAEACYRVGAGLVTIACPASLQPMIAAAIPEVTWLPLADEDGTFGERAIDQIITEIASFDAMLIGPGLSQRPGVADAVLRLLAAIPANVRACVIDADALNALAVTPGWQERLTTPAILTPHPGEMARLLGGTVGEVQHDRLNVAVKASADWRQVVVLKGAHTVIAAPDGRAAVSPYANPLLATAGTGDVLAGAIAGLLAQGMEPFEAAASGVYLHALAADDLSEDLGDRGMLASELLPALPRAIRTVLHGKPSRGGAMPFTGLGDLSALAGLGGAPGATGFGDA
jgi:ADP-dependent NAD(P)H-hydrate dehydratase / NAD(P)H-hydrate epimerase